jgi:5-carboxymethyl-2-hydroxymuconate isomerase
MPHLVIQYTPGLSARSDIAALCRTLSDLLVGFTDDDGGRPFPVGGVRVLAFPATHASVADAAQSYEFVYLNLRIAPGRSRAVIERAGQAMTEAARSHFEPIMAAAPMGLTLQIDETTPVFDAKVGTLHAHFKR